MTDSKFGVMAVGTNMAAVQKAIQDQGTSVMAMVKGHPKTGEMIGLRIRTTDGWLIVATKTQEAQG